MSYNKIVFLVETPILERYYKRYGIQELRDLGFETTIFDLSPILLPTAYQHITKGLCDYDECGFYRFFDLETLKKVFKEMDSETTLLICSMGYLWSYRHVFRIIKRYGLHFCYFMQEITPTDATKVNKSDENKLSISRIKDSITRRIPLQLHGISFADFIIGCGDDRDAIEAYKRARLCKEECQIIFFHSSNYEECLVNKTLPSIYNEKFCVFIDQYLPYHTDLIKMGICIDANKYYQDMNKLFDLIEEKLGIKVVIAAHPRSDYEKNSGAFGDRDIVYNKTCQLVKEAEFVIYHFSNSLAYVTLFNKPLLVVVNNEILHFFSEAVNKICQQMNVKYLNLNEDYSFSVVKSNMSIDENVYLQYVQRYMKKDYDGVIQGEKLWVQIGKYLKNEG